MRWPEVVCVLAALHGGGGVTKSSESGLAKFWTDDFKIFEQVYGKTSDKELYGATLPPNYSFDTSKYKKNEAAEKKKLRTVIDENDLDAFGAASQLGSYSINQQYVQSLNNKIKNVKASTPAKSTVNFITYSGFKPISQNSDPDTYSYLKRLESLQKSVIGLPTGFGGFKPYLSYASANPEDVDSYKSIQDILHAHEANKGNTNKDKDLYDISEFLGNESLKGRKKASKTRFESDNNVTKPRCSGRCRKRGVSPTRPRTRPVLRKIKKTIISD